MSTVQLGMTDKRKETSSFVMSIYMQLRNHKHILNGHIVTLKVLVATIDAQWEGMGDVGSARYEPALFPPCPTIRVLSFSN